MKNVGILTIFGGTNYGNKLQNFALQRFLINNGYNAETIRYRVSYNKSRKGATSKVFTAISKYYSAGIEESIYNTMRLTNKYVHKAAIQKRITERRIKIEKFESEHINISNSTYNTNEQLRQADLVYDRIIVGSDQVWNPFWQGAEDEFFLTFAKREKRIAYAPSIGVSRIPKSQIERYINLLSGFDSLSCREKDGAEMISSLTGRECINVVDPVFLIDRSDWNELSYHSHRKGYVVTYFLAGMNSKTQKIIRDYAKEKGLDIIDIFSEDTIDSEFAGIEDFISLIGNADIVFTDSFHGTAFSIIMKKQFVICDRRFQKREERMNSRIDSLLEKLSIRKRYIYDDEWRVRKISFNEVDAILMPWIQMSKEYLITQLERY